MALPKFLIKRIPKQENIARIRTLIGDSRIHTVCESAKCPNIGECFSNNTLTFMILGDVCTRNCRFCGVKKGIPLPPDPEEPKRIVQAIKKLQLDYVVITSVTRDDLPDGGASQFAKVICSIRSLDRTIKIEVLIPDFQGNNQALRTVLDAGPFILNHNIETIPRLYSTIRPQANYKRSLDLLWSANKYGVYTKSGFMVGLGESREEIVELLKDLRSVECDIVTIGQYLPPTSAHPKVERYVPPEEFEEYKQIGNRLGLKVEAGPFVRSSYRAKEIIWKKHSVY